MSAPSKPLSPSTLGELDAALVDCENHLKEGTSTEESNYLLRSYWERESPEISHIRNFCQQKYGVFNSSAVLKLAGDLCLQLYQTPDRIETLTLPEVVAAMPSPKAKTPDRFADLRQFALAELKGQERAVIEALCDAGGELPIPNLAVKVGLGWDDANKGFESAQRRLNPKIKKQRWKLTRQNNAARLTELPLSGPRKTR